MPVGERKTENDDMLDITRKRQSRNQKILGSRKKVSIIGLPTPIWEIPGNLGWSMEKDLGRGQGRTSAGYNAVVYPPKQQFSSGEQISVLAITCNSRRSPTRVSARRF